MASVRPSVARSASYQRVPNHDSGSLRPQKEELRSRSHSRNRPSKLYNADASRHYLSNESRARKPPPSPSIEDQGFGPEEVKMRGKTDQTPMLIQIGSDSGSLESTSSKESSEPMTPDTSSDSGHETRVRFSDDEEVFEPRPEIHRHAKWDRDAQSPHKTADNRERRRRSRDKSRTGRDASSTDDPPPRMERARSPYSYRPPPEIKEENKHQSARQSLTPDSPRSLDRPRSLKPQAIAMPTRHMDATAHPVHTQSGTMNAKDGSKRPARPLFERRASALPQLGSPVAARSRYVENSSDESDIELYKNLRARAGQLTSDALPTNSASYFDTPRQSGRHSISNTPPQTPPLQLSPEHTHGPFMSRDSLINGPALQHLSTALESKQRQASPRVSPQTSPNASPYPSPPQTPLERHHKRSSTVEVLQKTAPSSSSPLTSRPSSPRPGVQTFTARQIDYDARPPPMMSQERRTSTWDSSQSSASLQHRAFPITSQDSATGSRPSSPDTRRPEQVSSSANNDSKMPRTREASFASASPRETGMLEPFESNLRNRKPSSEDLRKALPQISTQQESDGSKVQRTRQKSGSYVPATAGPALGASLGADLLSPTSSSHRSHSTAPESQSHRRHRSRSRTASDARNAPRSQSSAPKQVTPASDQKQPVLLPQCPRPEAVAGFDDWYTLDQDSAMLICPECRHNNFGRGWERAFRRAAKPKRGKEITCGMNDPWVRLACLDAFGRQRTSTKVLGLLSEVTEEELPCPGSQLEEDRTWYHLRDNETGRDFKDFHICSHCVYSLESIYTRLGDIFIHSKELKKDEARVCSLRSDVHRFGKYLNAFVAMAKDADALPKNVIPPTSDFIWEVKWMTIISPCNGAAVHYGQDMHLHPDLPQLTICEECYYKTVRPLLKANRKDTSHFIHRIAPEAKEIVGASTCKLYSPRMRQIFATAVEDRDWDYFAKAVKKRSELQQDLEEAKAVSAKSPTEDAKKEVEYLKGKWTKLERRHD